MAEYNYWAMVTVDLRNAESSDYPKFRKVMVDDLGWERMASVTTTFRVEFGSDAPFRKIAPTVKKAVISDLNMAEQKAGVRIGGIALALSPVKPVISTRKLSAHTPR